MAGLMEHWGLTEASESESSPEIAQFKERLRPIIESMNAVLQYTVVNAEDLKHDGLVGKLDDVYDLYQDVTKSDKKDSEESCSPADMDKVVTKCESLDTEAQSLQEDTESALHAWNARESDFAATGDQVRELDDWGHEEAPSLHEAVDAIQTNEDDRKWEEALQALDQLAPKLDPVYEDYLQQKAAKEQYDPALAALQPRLDSVAAPDSYESLAPQQSEINAATCEMESAAETKDYVQALQDLEGLTPRVDEYERAVEELDRQREEYEQARAEVDPRLTEVATCEYQSLADMDQQIADMTTQIDESVAAEQFEQATQFVGDLSAKVDEKRVAIEELDRLREAYEQARAEVDAKLAESSQHEYQSLAQLNQQITDLTYQVDETAAAEEYELATKLVAELSAKVDEKRAKVEELDRLREAYEQARAEVDTKLAESSQHEYQSLAELDQQITDATNQVDEAAAAEEYELATKLVAELSANVDERHAKVEELDRLRDAYEQARAEVDAKLAESSQHEYQSLAELDQQITDLTNQVDETAAAEEYEQATKLVAELSAKVEEKRVAIEELDRLREAYEQARAEVDAKLAESSQHEYQSLAELDQQITDLTNQVDETAAPEEYEQATKLVAELSAKVDEKHTKVEELDRLRETYEQARAELEPRLIEASSCEHESLVELDVQIVDLTNQVDEIVAVEEYEQAAQLVPQLSAKVDEKLAAAEELGIQKQEYEQARAELEPTLSEVSTCKDESLAQLDEQIADLTTKTDKAAAAEDFDHAAQLVDELSAKADEKLTAIDELDSAGADSDTTEESGWWDEIALIKAWRNGTEYTVEGFTIEESRVIQGMDCTIKVEKLKLQLSPTIQFISGNFVFEGKQDDDEKVNFSCALEKGKSPTIGVSAEDKTFKVAIAGSPDGGSVAIGTTPLGGQLRWVNQKVFVSFYFDVLHVLFPPIGEWIGELKKNKVVDDLKITSKFDTEIEVTSSPRFERQKAEFVVGVAKTVGEHGSEWGGGIELGTSMETDHASGEGDDHFTKTTGIAYVTIKIVVHGHAISKEFPLKKDATGTYVELFDTERQICAAVLEQSYEQLYEEAKTGSMSEAELVSKLESGFREGYRKAIDEMEGKHPVDFGPYERPHGDVYGIYSEGSNQNRVYKLAGSYDKEVSALIQSNRIVKMVHECITWNGQYAIEGVYSSDFGDVHLTTKNGMVYGKYSSNGVTGEVEGKITNNGIQGEWGQDNQLFGTMTWQIQDNGQRLDGEYESLDGSAMRGPWTLQRK